MKFRLTYRGELRPTQRGPQDSQKDSLASHKQKIRRVFNGQLKQLWTTNRFLRDHRVFPKSGIAYRPIADIRAVWGGDEDKMIPMVEEIAAHYHRFDYRFVPLVRDEISLLCSIDVLFLRNDTPGSLLHAGDLDNRIKTLIDALCLPISPNEMEGDQGPGADEDPFFCLLEDDRQVSKLSVETDALLEAHSSDLSLAHLVSQSSYGPIM